MLSSQSQLDAALSADRLLRARLEKLHAEGVAEARRFDGNKAAMRSYSRPAEPGSRVDLSL
jgi:hypothetical protein